MDDRNQDFELQDEEFDLETPLPDLDPQAFYLALKQALLLARALPEAEAA
jgi:hypothetical protein